MAPEPDSPSASSVLLPLLGSRARRGSLASISSSKGEIDRQALAQVLDSIHTTASKSDTLTSFHDYDGGAPRAGAKDLVSNGISGLYERYIRGIAGGTPVKEGSSRQKSSAKSSPRDTQSQKPDPSNASSRVASATRASDAASIKSGLSTVNELSKQRASFEGPPATTEATQDREGLAESPESKRHPSNGFQSEADLGARDAKNRTDFDRSTSLIAGNERGETAAQALARVLSHHGTATTDNSRHTRSLHGSRELAKIAGDSDTDITAERSRSNPPQASNTNRTVVEDFDRSNLDPLPDQATPRPPMAHVGISHLPGYNPSRTSSTDGGDVASVSSSQTGQLKPAFESAPNLTFAPQYRTITNHHYSRHSHPSEGIPQHLKRRVISKAFWMKDENAKDCFYCGEGFSTFRRKHHCRTCGQIFDAKCTSLVPGRPFGQPGTIRLCKPCEAMIYGSDDDQSTVFSDDASEFHRTPTLRRTTNYEDGGRDARTPGVTFDEDDLVEVATPSIAIPASRRNREAKRRSAVIEFDAPPPLTRPVSSHSLISLSRRPRSSSHRRLHSRHQNVRGTRGGFGHEQVPFQQDDITEAGDSAGLSAFHNDNIIDPDLAPYASEDGTDDDERPNIFGLTDGANGSSPNDGELPGSALPGVLTKKARTKTGLTAAGKSAKDDEALSEVTKHLPKLSRRRNLSFGSTSINRASPRRSRSTNLIKQVADPDSFDRRHDLSSTPSKDAVTRSVRSSAMHGIDAPPMELSTAGLEHLKRLLRQMLTDYNIPAKKTWEKALMPILLQCTDDVEPNVQVGDDMDIRHYIKLKKTPGGKPGDTSYINGVVFSKNVALKSMARSISRPRIAIVTFAVEYARHQAHFMSLEPVIAQEQEYLRNLIGRIAALRPQLLLVQRNVSGTALELLEKAGIAVAYNIKESVLAAVARVTRTTMIKSVDKLAIDPSHLGRCDSFEVKTYVYDGARKSYIFLSGCPPELGCTVVLRGADTESLRKMKRIAEFMCYVTYNVKLETSLLRDEFVSIPTTAPHQLQSTDSPSQNQAVHRSIGPMFGHGESKGDPDIRSRGGGDKPSKYEKVEMESRARILSASPFVVFMQPYLLTQLRESERRLTTYKLLRDQYAAADEAGDEDEKGEVHAAFQMVQPEMVHAAPSKDQPKALREYLHAVHEAQLEKTKYTYDTQKRLMDSFMSTGINPFDPYAHQTIVVLQSTVCTINSAPCGGPDLLGIGFYAGFNRVEPQFEEDCTLGQYIEDHCLSAGNTCKECGKKMYDHHRQYVHGYGQLSVSIKRQPAKMRGYQKTILMWATCRICKQETTVTPMSDNTWKYSFAKYLELSFWSSPLHPRAGVCEHDLHKDFLRCFGFEELVVCVQYDSVDIYDVVVPRPTITWKVESDLRVKNEQFSHIVSRLNAFTESIKKRLDSINVDTLDEKRAIEAHDLLEELHKRAEDEHQELLDKLQAKYSQSRYYELIPLNRALRFMDEKALAWDDTFNDFERDYFPSETDIRKLATLQLRNMFLESQPPLSTGASDASDSEEGTEMVSVPPKKLNRGSTEPFLGSDKVHDVLSSTVEEHRNSIVDIDDVRPLTAAAADTSKTLSVREEQEQAVEREDVKHLDLAVPTMPPQDESALELQPTSSDQSGQTIQSESEDSPTQEGPFATQSSSVGAGLMERIEQIRSYRQGDSGDGETGSRIPRLADLKKRDLSPRPSLLPPPLLRARSSPSPPRRSHHRSNDSEHSIDAVANAANLSHTHEMHIAERLGMNRLASKVGKLAPSLIPRSILNSDEPHNTRVSALAKHFEQMSKEFERERQKERRQRVLRSRQARANPLASSRPVVEVYRNATDAVGERNVEQVKAEASGKDSLRVRIPLLGPSSDEQPAEAARDEEAQPKDSDEQPAHAESEGDSEADVSDSEQPHSHSRNASEHTAEALSSALASPTSAGDMDLMSELTIPDHKKSVWLKYLADFWSKRTSSGWTSLEYPLHTTEHVFEDSDIIVREDEPSSVIALSLSSPDYQNKVQEFRSHPKKNSKLSRQAHSQLGDVADEDHRERALEASLLSDTGTHMKYSFAHGPVRATCKIFYAEAFDALRRKCGVADRFVESVSRCLKFDMKGGKTKSLFLKTLDSRFYIKSLQEVELKAFTKFAPDYFAFMSHTLFHGVPSVIAKMFGLFQVIIKNPATGMDFSYYLLVMENLFYERNPNRRFDLKGSMRNRKIESTGQPDEVLLDENLVEAIFESPLFVREHARKLLQASVWNDTMWLCKQNVMDYSLMAGFDDDRKELVVGIIDCIRTYTWDKKLESWIKDRGKNKPTITSPKDYRNRFRVSMMQYVLQAPNCWHQFQTQMPMPKTLKEREDAVDEAEKEREKAGDGRREGIGVDG
ncbi:hypothetical protein BDY17DRAFT_294537 [Neohortaea acidophila]|uniref:1-phosphatidylinositol-3-phosphate 5-kinase n=1 Tax=Neohortaea acidophila TaxID=245834 RepID=A0A6A6PVP8_9PEZI|nr:uncharacterized protein BDY17DRAFT_294537 [Neohortaea acidophila]KAF2483846.1 hypothetical protein BDY17DRAFT_294537 [Neohortaea acidophila]